MSADMPTLAVITAALAKRLTSIVFVPSRPPCFGVFTRFADENHPAAQRKLWLAVIVDLGGYECLLTASILSSALAVVA
jgi:hypothetical protein